MIFRFSEDFNLYAVNRLVSYCLYYDKPVIDNGLMHMIIYGVQLGNN